MVTARKTPRPPARLTAPKLPLLLGAIPLALGISIFLLWIMTDWTLLAFLGALTLYAGVLSVLTGMIYLVVWLVKAVRSPSPSSKNPWRSAAFTAGLLLINFPAARVILWAVDEIERTYTVVIRNHTGHPIHAASISGGTPVSLGTLQPGACVSRMFRHAKSAAVIVSGELNGQTIKINVSGYTLGGRHYRNVTILPDGRPEITESGSNSPIVRLYESLRCSP